MSAALTNLRECSCMADELLRQLEEARGRVKAREAERNEILRKYRASRPKISAHIRRLKEERDTWKATAAELRVVASQISGILCDAGDVPTGDLVAGVRALLEQRDAARSR